MKGDEMDVREPRPSQLDEVQENIFSFLEAPSWGARGALVREHPYLLSRTAEEMLNNLITEVRRERPDLAEGLQGCRDVLVEARSVGFDRAVERLAE
jgi:hypothetical protein